MAIVEAASCGLQVKSLEGLLRCWGFCMRLLKNNPDAACYIFKLVFLLVYLRDEFWWITFLFVLFFFLRL